MRIYPGASLSLIISAAWVLSAGDVVEDWKQNVFHMHFIYYMNNKNTLDGEYGEYNSNLSMRIMDEASFIGSVSVIYLRDILVFHVFSAGVDLFFCMVVYYDGS
ncbi:hypothetical protein ATN83_3277 [Raoultella ornithinolytica]|nr:hypothetical protein ATN83_3277 [Raoultella ornithinolytica]KIZ46675.1 hypothetical protein OO18_02005 [Raoultella ornithinolytica]